MGTSQAVVRLCRLRRLARRRPKTTPAGMASLGPTCLDIFVAMHQGVRHSEVQEFREPPSEEKETNSTPTVRQLPAWHEVGVYSIQTYLDNALVRAAGLTRVIRYGGFLQVLA